MRRRQHLTTTDRKIKLYYPVDHSGVTDISAYIYITTPLHALNSLLILYSLLSTIVRVQYKSVSKLTNIATTGNSTMSEWCVWPGDSCVWQLCTDLVTSKTRDWRMQVMYHNSLNEYAYMTAYCKPNQELFYSMTLKYTFIVNND